ncbi:MAG TPA: discoidin domain-containing protein [Actinophytocola sp.]|uniref:discoidin domain-containing protein n=1 Tax=Actinophytocola sp. TaxID=1872138 RepID=UPI002DDD9904|nr:discoidin domain-containing protein [Actinophytocola sp.]HEV2778054.1 discoidin domain-containing protein [Actinophytocola sp.]
MKRLISRLIPAILAGTLLPTLLPLAGPAAPAEAAPLAATLTASSATGPYVASNAGDGNRATYWESANNAFPQWIQADLGAAVAVDRVVLTLPTANWPARTQTLAVRGSTNGTGFTDLVASAGYAFDPATGSTVTITFAAATVRYVRLHITANTGWPAGQLSELEVHGPSTGEPAPRNLALGKPITASSHVHTFVATNANDDNASTYWEGAANSYPNTLTVSLGANATISSVVVRLNPDPIWGRRTQTIEVLGREQSATAFTTIAAAAPYVFDPASGNTVTIPVSATAADVRLRYTANTGAPAGQAAELQVFGVPEPDPDPVVSSDLVASPVSWSPSNPAAGDVVTFSVGIRNQGTVASASGAHGITLTVLDAGGATVRTLTGGHTGVIGAGATTAPVNLGTWTAANGRYTVRVVLADDANELPAMRGNNTSSHNLFVGRGASMPYDMYEAEDAVIGGGATIVGPNRTVGDLAGEASGRRAVTLNSTGSFVEFTTRASTNTLVTRFSIPDAPGGGGIGSTLNIYVNGAFHKAINLTSRFAWLYGAEASPGNSPGAGPPRHIYDEANVLLNATVPAGSRIRLQKDPANGTTYAIDFVNLEQVAPIPNPDPARYAVPAGFTHQDVQNALDRVRMDSTGNLVGVYLPPGDYQTSGKFQVYLKPVRVIGAGPWYTRFLAPSTQDNTDVGFRAESTANGSVFANFAYFGNYTSRIDGPGKVFDFSNVADMVIDNIWAEHMVCLYWGTNTDRVTIRNSRIRNLFADAINMTNGSTGNLVTNNESRASGDDSFALFNAQDAGGGEVTGNVYENLTSLLTWRAAGVAVYGGFNNVFRNIHIADTLVYSGITISSLDFGIPMNGFGADPPTRFENISIVRAGGHFWGAQTFPAIWIFSASKVFQGIRVSNVDIVDPTYHGIMFQTNYVGGSPQFPIRDTVFTNITITGARGSGDQFDAKSGFAIWANEMPEPSQGPAVGSAVFNGLTMRDNRQNIRNTTSTFTITVNP